MERSEERQKQVIEHLDHSWREMPLMNIREYLQKSNVADSPHHYKITGTIRVIQEGHNNTLYRIYDKDNSRNIAEFSMPIRDKNNVEAILEKAKENKANIIVGVKKGNFREMGRIESVDLQTDKEDIEVLIF